MYKIYTTDVSCAQMNIRVLKVLIFFIRNYDKSIDLFNIFSIYLYFQSYINYRQVRVKEGLINAKCITYGGFNKVVTICQPKGISFVQIMYSCHMHSKWSYWLL